MPKTASFLSHDIIDGERTNERLSQKPAHMEREGEKERCCLPGLCLLSFLAGFEKRGGGRRRRNNRAHFSPLGAPAFILRLFGAF